VTGGWAATNTLRDAVETLHNYGCRVSATHSRDAIALVEAALDAAEKFEQGGIDLSNVEFDQAATALAAALRAVREGK
jgi:hypothetical protein